MTRIRLTNAALLDGDAPMRTGMTVLIEGERIAAIGADALAGDADETLDLQGLTLMPGMVTGHFHAGYYDIGLARGFPAIERPPIYAGYRALASVQTALRCGFTGVVGAGAPYDMDAQLDAAIRDGIFVGPRMVPSSRDFYSPADADFFTSWWIKGEPNIGLTRICSGPEEFRRGVREEVNRGARMIKAFVTGGHGIHVPKSVEILSRDELEAIVETAHARGARVRTHITTKDRILHAIACGVDVLDHADEMDEECIEAMAKAGTFLLPSLMYPALMVEAMRANPAEPMLFSEEDRRDFEHMCRMLPKAVEAGVKICVGDDYGSPIMPHGMYGRELSVYVEHADIEPLEVLRWATRNGGALMGQADLGMIAPGMLADMIVVRGDPSADVRVLADPANVRTVFKGGQRVHEA